MRKALLGSIAAVAAGAGWLSGQSPRMPSSVMPPPVAVAPTGILPASGMMDPGAMPPEAAPMGAPMGGPMMGALDAPPGLQGAFRGPDIDNGAHLAPKFEFNGRYLLYFAKSQPTPGALVTTSAPGSFGVLGSPTTRVMHGGDDFTMDAISGFDLTGTLWKDPDRRLGIMLGGMRMETKHNSFNGFSDDTGNPVLARPFTNAATGVPESLLVTFPGSFAGGVMSTATTNFWGAEGNLVFNLYRSCPGDWCVTSLNTFGGFLYRELDESITVTQTSRILPGVVAPFGQQIFGFPGVISVRDQVKTINQFYGGNLGVALDVRYGRVYLGATGKMGIGVMHQKLQIDGASSLTNAQTGTNAVLSGGLLANAANMGRFNNDRFAIVPEASVTLGYNWTSWFSTTVGYGFTYMDKVIRPGQQISSTVNTALVPAHPSYGGGAVGVPNPAFTESSFWIQGVQFGFNFRW